VTSASLPRSAPSDQGVDPAGVLAFLHAVASRDLDMHSLMLVRHGSVVAEGWWAPYRSDRIHLVYSLSKSFTSTAIGIAVGEGLLSVDDPIVKFFPDQLPSPLNPLTAATRVKDLLAMASGHAEDTWGRVASGGPDLVRTFLSIPPDEPPGTIFTYNQGCTYTLSAIITKLTGQRLVDYLRPRLFGPLGIDRAEWTQAGGIDRGYSGLHVATESIAKLGLLHLQGGEWEGAQLVPAGYVADAHRFHSDNSRGGGSADWSQGYGYQFWICRHDSYRGDGAYGQFCVVIPAADAVVACTAQVMEMDAQLDLIWEHLLPALSGGAEPDPGAEAELQKRLKGLAVRGVEAGADGPGHAVTFARNETPAPGTGGLKGIRVEPLAGGNRLTVLVAGNEHVYDLGQQGWTEGMLPGLDPCLAEVAVSGGWVTTDEFRADLVSLTSPHRIKLTAFTEPEPLVAVSWQTTPL
jgi:CubicO group peptidase (beta-lactamase class C family)